MDGQTSISPRLSASHHHHTPTRHNPNPSIKPHTPMSTQTTTPLQLTKLLSLLGSGLITGSILSLSIYTIPALLLPSLPHRPLPPRTIQAQWSHIYHSGKRTIPVLALATSAGYLYLWRAVGGGAAAGGGGKARLYALGAACTIAIVPYTIMFMRGNIDGLERAGEGPSPSATTTTTPSTSASAISASTTTTTPTQMPTISISSAEDTENAGVQGGESTEPVAAQQPTKESLDAARRVVAAEEARSVRMLVDQWGMLNLGRAALTGTGFVVGLWAALT
ncbi:hypothetical protein DFH27DRAFT_604269 [Peziza echinospora]|nr:hypothetical protein DFH27DRAFT_604269 [Peziza echinospora]